MQSSDIMSSSLFSYSDTGIRLPALARSAEICTASSEVDFLDKALILCEVLILGTPILET
jgi:hypothetical protein